MAREIAELTGKPFVTAPNKFAAQGSLDAMVASMAALRGLAVALMKAANDMRWLASGPRCGLGELHLPANEPGSSIMPGKVNPTQCEAMVMVCIQVIGEDNAVAFAGSQGNFELNAMRPIIINNVLHAARILGDACGKMRQFSIEGTELNRPQIDEMVSRSLMLVTALSPVVGYDDAAHIAEAADRDGGTLRDAAVKSGKIDAEEVRPGRRPQTDGRPRRGRGLTHAPHATIREPAAGPAWSPVRCPPARPPSDPVDAISREAGQPWARRRWTSGKSDGSAEAGPSAGNRGPVR